MVRRPASAISPVKSSEISMRPPSARQASETDGSAAPPPGGPLLARAAPGIFVLLWATGFLIAKLGVP